MYTSIALEIGYLGIGILISGVLGLIYYIVMAHYLNPKYFGIFSTFFFSIMIIGRFLSYGIKINIARRISAGEKINRVLVTALLSSLIVLTFFIVGYFKMFDYISTILFDGNAQFSKLLVFGVIFFIPFMLIEGVLQGKKHMKKIGLQKIIGDLLKILSFFVVVHYKLDILGVLVSVVAFIFIFSIVSFLFVFDDIRGITPPTIRFGCIKEFIGESLLISIIHGCVMFVFFGPPVVIKIMSGSFELTGMFAATFTLLKTPVILYEAVLISILPNVSKASTEGDENKLLNYIKYSKIITIVVVLVFVVASTIFGTKIIEILYGEEYVMERVHIFLISLIISLYTFASLYNEILIGMNRVKEATVSWIVAFIPFVISLSLSIDDVFKTEIAFIVYNLMVVIFLKYYLKMERRL